MSFIESIQQNWTTAFIFWMVFLFSMLLAKVYQQQRVVFIDGDLVIRPMSKILQFFWFMTIITGPALLVGFRRIDVGVDTFNYWVGYMNIGSFNYSFLESFRDLGYERPLFFLVQYIIHFLSDGNPTFFLFIIALLTLYFLICGLNKLIGKISLPIALFVYYSFFGMQLLNQSRQLLALSILVYALTFLFERKSKSYLILIIIASLIHYTALIGLLFYLLNFKRSRTYSIKNWIFISILLVSPFFLAPILSFLTVLVPNKYDHYLTVGNALEDVGFGLFLNVVPVLLPIILFRKYLTGFMNNYLIRIAYLTLPFRLAGYYSYYLMRMYYYGAITIVLIIPIVIQNISNKTSRYFALSFLILLCLLYYLINYIYVNGNIMFPYYSIYSEEY